MNKTITTIFDLLPICTLRLILDIIQASDSDCLFNEYSEEIAEYMYHPAFKNREQANELVINRINENKLQKNAHFVIRNKDSEFIGCLGLIGIDTNKPQIYLWIKKSAQGIGYASELVEKIVSLGSVLKWEYINYPACINNKSSLKIPLQLGAKLSAVYDLNTLGGNKLEINEYRFYFDSFA